MPHVVDPAKYAKKDAMARFVADERRREPTVRYGELERRIRAKFGCSITTAQSAITLGTQLIRDDFQKFAADAPRAIFDAYMDIHTEAMREKNWNAARRALDSVRDMFGMRKAPINVFMNGDAPPPEAFAPLTDAQLDAMAAMDQTMLPAGTTGRVIDIDQVEQAVAVANAAVSSADEQDEDDDDDDDE